MLLDVLPHALPSMSIIVSLQTRLLYANNPTANRRLQCTGIVLSVFALTIRRQHRTRYPRADNDIHRYICDGSDVLSRVVGL